MTKRERVLAAFQGKEVDHVPVSMWKHVPSELWGDDNQFAEYQVKFAKDTDVDFIKLSADKYFCWPAPILDGIINAEDLYKIEPLGPDHPHIRGQIERTKKIVQLLGEETPAIYLVFAPLSYLRLQVGYPTMMKLIRENPEAMKYACNVIAEDVKYLVKGLIEEAGVLGIFYSVQNGEENRFTAEEYRNWVAPSDKAVLDYANSLCSTNSIHFCAWEEIPNRLSVWEDYDAAVISWSRYIDIMDIQEAKKHFGTTVWGGFDNRPGTFLFTASREEIEAEVKNLIEQGGKTGYILGADCSIGNTLSDERIAWVVEASRKF